MAKSMKVSDQRHALYLLKTAEELIQYLLPMAKDKLPVGDSRDVTESDILRAVKRMTHFQEDMAERSA